MFLDFKLETFLKYPAKANLIIQCEGKLATLATLISIKLATFFNQLSPTLPWLEMNTALLYAHSGTKRGFLEGFFLKIQKKNVKLH